MRSTFPHLAICMPLYHKAIYKAKHLAPAFWLAVAGLCSKRECLLATDRSPVIRQRLPSHTRARESHLTHSSSQEHTTSTKMLYGFIKNMPKSQAMTVTLGGALGLSYATWAFYRYTGTSRMLTIPTAVTMLVIRSQPLVLCTRTCSCLRSVVCALSAHFDLPTDDNVSACVCVTTRSGPRR